MSFYRENKVVIFDVGANAGQSVSRFKKIFPLSTIFCFEPQVTALEKLKSTYGKDPNVIINDFALGAESGRLTLRERIKSGTTSFNLYNTKSKYVQAKLKWHGVDESGLITHEYDVNVKTLDEVCANFDAVDVLKIDVEGFEKYVLQGGQDSIKAGKFQFIELELTLDDRFGNRGNFFDVEQYLVPYGYTICAFDDLFSAVERPIFHLNVLYAKRSVTRAFDL
jgi:FkbM family methyltransferase